MANLNNDILNVQDPGNMDEELFQVPGLVNELTTLTMANAPRPNKPLAFMGALACVSHLAGRTYEDEHGTHANLYLVALAPTGMGKDEPRLTNQRLANAIDILESVPDQLASPEGLEDALKRSPALLLQNDEADALFGAMSSSGLRAKKLNSAILRLYSQSKGVLSTRLKAGEKKPIVIEKPHLTLFATGIPEFVYQALSPKALLDGLMGRCLFVSTQAFCRLGTQANLAFSDETIDAARFMADRERAFAKSGVYAPLVVKATREAQMLIDEMKHKADDLAEEALKCNEPIVSALLCRFAEKAQKLALVAAISKDPYAPALTPEALTWAAKFVTYATKQMIYNARQYIAENPFERLKKRFLAKLQRNGGSCDHSTMLRTLTISASQFKQLVLTLKMCDDIEDQELPDGKREYILK